jgi:protein gp37
MARRFGRNPVDREFRYHFHPSRLMELAAVKKPSRVFVVSMGDLFGDWVPGLHLVRVLDWATAVPRHLYLFLTKNPSRMSATLRNRLVFGGPAGPALNWWSGVSATNQTDYDRRLGCVLEYGAPNPWVSVEPMLGPVRLGWLLRPRWVVIGAMTGPEAKRNSTQPNWVWMLAKDCRKEGVPCFVKDNAPWRRAWGKRPRQLPDWRGMCRE